MSKLVIAGGARLMGEIAVEGSKNAVLPILAASLLNGGESVIKNCPRLRDVEVMLEILKKIGCGVKTEGDIIIVNSSTINDTRIPVELAAEMRSSIIFMGPMLARCGKVTISHPGGCETLRAQMRPDCGMENLPQRYLSGRRTEVRAWKHKRIQTALLYLSSNLMAG